MKTNWVDIKNDVGYKLSGLRNLYVEVFFEGKSWGYGIYLRPSKSLDVLEEVKLAGYDAGYKTEDKAKADAVKTLKRLEEIFGVAVKKGE